MSLDNGEKSGASKRPTTITKVVDGKIVGHVTVQPDKNTQNAVYLRDLYVEPDQRGRGFGSELLKQVLESHPGGPIKLEVDRTNAPAIKLYEKAGFIVIESIDSKKGVTYFRMEKPPDKNAKDD